MRTCEQGGQPWFHSVLMAARPDSSPPPRSGRSDTSRPSSSRDSNSPGATVLPEMATRTGVNSTRGFSPVSSQAARSAASIEAASQVSSASSRSRAAASEPAASGSSATRCHASPPSAAGPNRKPAKARTGSARAASPAPAARPRRPAPAAPPAPSRSGAGGRAARRGRRPPVSARRCSPFSHSSFWKSNTAGLLLTRSSVNRSTSSGVRHHGRLVVEAPAQQGEVVLHRLGQVAAVAELLDRHRAVALGELLAVRPEDHRQVGVGRALRAQRRVEGELARGRREQVLARG